LKRLKHLHITTLVRKAKRESHILREEATVAEENTEEERTEVAENTVEEADNSPTGKSPRMLMMRASRWSKRRKTMRTREAVETEVEVSIVEEASTVEEASAAVSIAVEETEVSTEANTEAVEREAPEVACPLRRKPLPQKSLRFPRASLKLQ